MISMTDFIQNSNKNVALQLLQAMKPSILARLIKQIQVPINNHITYCKNPQTTSLTIQMMLNSILKRSQSINHESPTSSPPQLNPQKPTQKTSQSSEQQKQQLTPEQYTKLQALLQSRQASLRQHAKHEYQLKLFIEDLQEKNKALQKNNANILAQYKAQVTAFKKQNQSLRKMVHKLQQQYSQLKQQLQQALSYQMQQKLHPANTTPQLSHNRAKSQSVIKVIESVDHKHSFRESQPNFRMSPFNMSGKESPIIPSQESKRNLQSQSKEKLQVTIKSSRLMENGKSSSYGRNQKQISALNVKQDESMERERSIKKLMELKKMNQGNQDGLINKKLQVQKGNFSISKKMPPQLQSSLNDQSNQYSEKSSYVVEEIAQQRIVMRNLSRDLGQGMRKSIHKGNSRQLASGEERRSKQIKKSKPNDHELIKLGHYGSSNLNVEKTNAHTSRNLQNQKGKLSNINNE